MSLKSEKTNGNTKGSKRTKCRFFEQGQCRYGSDCRFLHLPKTMGAPETIDIKAKKSVDKTWESKRIEELDALFKKYTVESESKTNFFIKLVPSDPEFVYPLSEFCFNLQVPEAYGENFPVSIESICTSAIPAELLSAIKLAFYQRSISDPKLTIVEMINWLDKNLESLLISNKTPSKVKVNLTKKKPKKIKKLSIFDDLETKELELNEPQFVEKTEDPPKSLEIAIAVRRGFDLQNIGFASCISVSVLAECRKCCGNFEVKNLTKATSCACKCGKLYEIEFSSKGVSLHEESMKDQLATATVIATIGVSEGCGIVDVLGVKYDVTCVRCLSSIEIIAEGHSRRRATVGCRTCHLILALESEPFSMDRVLLESKINESRKLKKIDEKKPITVAKKIQEKTEAGPPKNNGTCKHYTRSFRLFRFSCCSRTFPCDDCHEELKKDGHKMQLARTIICGFCGKEQSCTSECKFCHKNLVGKASASGFWEGGKGTRNKLTMNTKDQRKYKNLGKTVSRKSQEK